MNSSKVKSLVQIQQQSEDHPERDQLSITVLLTEEVLKSMLDQMRSHEDKRASIVAQMASFGAEVTIEVYEPKAAKNLRYVENLKRDGKDGWTTQFVTTL